MKVYLSILVVFGLLLLGSFVAFGQSTNAPAGLSDDTANQYLNSMVEWNNKLLGLPSGVLVLIVMFLFNSVLYYAEFFPNRNIPLFSIVGGALIYFLLSWRVGADTLPVPIWATKNIVIGCIIGCVAWIASLRYGMKLVGKLAGKPDPSPPLPEKPVVAPTAKIEVELVAPKPVAAPADPHN